MVPILENLKSRPIKTAWDLLSPLPGGKVLFSKAVGRAAPYSGTLGAIVEELHEGYGRVRVRERPGLRQHLGSVHAIALANLGELCTGLTMYYTLPDGARGIVTRFEVEYHKKGRGLLVAECRAEPVSSREEHTEELRAEIRDEAGDLVATATAHWLIRPV